MENELNPTLWRTCRMLANTRRLRIIHQLIDKEPQTLTQLAKVCKMSVSACSQYTRHITARGLCREIRNGRFAYFDLHADPAIPYSDALLKAVIRSVRESKRDYRQHLAELTAYTHISRIRMMCYVVQHGVSTASEMQSALHISKPALFRHLDKLIKRNVLESVETGGYQWVKPKSVLARELLCIATGCRSHTS